MDHEELVRKFSQCWHSELDLEDMVKVEVKKMQLHKSYESSNKE